MFSRFEWIQQSVSCLRAGRYILIIQMLPMKAVPANERNNIQPKEDNDISTYRKLPVSKFGQQMLEQMGWTQDRGVGRNTQNALLKPVEYQPRPQQAGLGSIEILRRERLLKNQQEPAPQPSNPSLKFKEVWIAAGKHKGLDAVILEERGDKYLVELKESGVKVNVSKDDLGEKEAASRSRSRSAKKLKWVQVGLRVKVKSKRLENGKYYKKKVTISDILDDQVFVALTNDNVVLEGLREADVKPTLPKRGGRVQLLDGGRVGLFVEKKDKKTVVVRVGEELIEVERKSVCGL